MKIIRVSVISILFLIFAFNSFSNSIEIKEKFNIENVVFEIYDIPSEKKGMNNAHIFLKIPYNFFRFIKEDEEFVAKYEFTVQISNEKINIGKIKSFQENIVVSNFEETNSLVKYILRDLKFELPPNKYDLKLIITDLDLQESIKKTREITLKNFWKDKFGISDVILSVNNDSLNTEGKNIIIPEPNIDIDYNLILVINYYIFKSEPRNSITLSSKILPEFLQDLPVYDESEKVNEEKHLIAREIRLDPSILQGGPYILKINISSEKTKIEKELKFSLLWENHPISEIDVDLALEQMKYILTEEEYEKTNL